MEPPARMEPTGGQNAFDHALEGFSMGFIIARTGTKRNVLDKKCPYAQIILAKTAKKSQNCPTLF
ncbi:hypothetical protein [Allofournierella sp.]|uniref:hypothetical protein n=1 Tax=Allofournierella sp. TaxID=1940256 RepID=UPI003AEF4E9F